MEEIQEVAINIDVDPSEITGDTDHGIVMTQAKGEELQMFLKKRLDALPGEPKDDPTDNMAIFRLPYHEMSKELCEPKVVAIGPYHRGKPNLQTLENIKWLTLRRFLAYNEKVGLQYYLDALKSLEETARQSYSEPVDLGSDEFLMMLLLDSCFIFECLSNADDYSIFGVGWNIMEIFYDLCLIENQVPFKVIHTLWAIRDQGEEWSSRCKYGDMNQPCPLFNLINQAFIRFNDYLSLKFKPILAPNFCNVLEHLLDIYSEGVISEFEDKIQTQSEQVKAHKFCGPCFKLFSRSNKPAASDRTQQSQSLQRKLSEAASDGSQSERGKSSEADLDGSGQNEQGKLSEAASDGNQNEQGKSSKAASHKSEQGKSSEVASDGNQNEQGKSSQAASDDNRSEQGNSSRVVLDKSDQGKSHSFFPPNCFPCSKLFSKPASKADYIGLKDVHIMCASELSDAGVKFRKKLVDKKKKTPTHLLDISFDSGTIEIPYVKIDSHFVRILWNLVAHEQTVYLASSSPFSSYLALMDSLINTEKDIALLERAGIIDNYFSNAEEAASFFNQFGKVFTLNYDEHYFYGLFNKVRDYSNSTWPKYRARFVQDYFSNPWTFISVVAAVVLFALTILQTYYSALSV